MAASNIHSVFSMTFPAKKNRQFGDFSIFLIFSQLSHFSFREFPRHVDTLKKNRDISVVWGVSEAASRRLVKDLEVRDELRSTCRRASHWGMGDLDGLPGPTSLRSTVIYLIHWYIHTHTCVVTCNYWVYYIQISKSQVYTHIRMSISTVYLYLHLHLHPYSYVYTQTLLRSVNPLQFSQPGHVLCLRCMHRREYLQLLEGALSRNWDVGHQNSDTAVWTNQPPNVGIFQVMRWARESIEVAMESRHPNTHTHTNPRNLAWTFFFVVSWRIPMRL